VGGCTSDPTPLLQRSHLEAAEAFYQRHGGKTIVIARFLPFVRTFAPIVAGAAGMSYRHFAMFNVIGAPSGPSACPWRATRWAPSSLPRP